MLAWDYIQNERNSESYLSRLEGTASAEQPPQSIYDNIQEHFNSEICPSQFCMKPRTTNRSRDLEKSASTTEYRYSERRKGAHVSAAIKIPGASNRTRPLWLPFLFRSRGGAVVRALASHQSGPGSIPGPGVICGLSLLLVLSLLREVFLRVLQFSPLLKNQHCQIQFDPECTDTCWTSSWDPVRQKHWVLQNSQVWC